MDHHKRLDPYTRNRDGKYVFVTHTDEAGRVHWQDDELRSGTCGALYFEKNYTARNPLYKINPGDDIRYDAHRGPSGERLI